MRILVVPSIREHSLVKFLRAWEGKGGWDKMILVEDNPTRAFAPIPGVIHYSWKEIAEIAGGLTWIFSRRDSAIRSFGYLAARWMGAEYIGTLDDDCYPHPEMTGTWFGAHEAAMNDIPKWIPSIPGIRTRGLPYRNLGTLQSHINHGLWSRVADYDSVQTFARMGQPDEYFAPPKGSRVIPSGQLFPFCSMNVCFRAAAAPLMYFPLMGEGQPYARFDDIWGGVIAKTIADVLGWLVTCGEPHVEHQRASDPFVNLVKEAPGIAFNEQFWEYIDSVHWGEINPIACVAELARKLQTVAVPYVSRLGDALLAWASLFTKNPGFSLEG